MSRNSVAKLSDIEAGLPSLTESAQCAQKLKAAIFDGITEADVSEIMRKQVAKAKEGDSKAAKFVVDVVNQAGPRVTVNVGVRTNRAGDAPGTNAHGRASPARPAGDQHAIRVACAQTLGRIGPLGAEDLADETEYPEEEITTALAADGNAWFERQANGAWRLTSIGRKETIAA